MALLLIFLLLLTATTTTTSTINSTTNNTYDDQELETTLQSLRTHGYTLFTNAISTSDLQYRLLTSQFTLFAPQNTPLFTLDMASEASAYVKTLCYHVIPDRRLTFSDLQNLSNPFLDTLLPHYSLLIGKTIDVSSSVAFNGTGLMVDGVRVSEPDLFLGPRIAVHGIDGVLDTGLNMRHQDFGGIDNNGSGLLSPAESPAPLSGFDWNIPAEGSPAPVSPGNIPAHGSPAPASHGNIPAEGSPAPVSHDNIPLQGSPASMSGGYIPAQGSPASMSRGNIPMEGIFPPIPEFDWSRVPVVPAPDSQPHGKISVEKPSEKLPGRADNIVGKKKHGKRHHRRHGRRHHDHRLKEF